MGQPTDLVAWKLIHAWAAALRVRPRLRQVMLPCGRAAVCDHHQFHDYHEFTVPSASSTQVRLTWKSIEHRKTMLWQKSAVCRCRSAGAEMEKTWPKSRCHFSYAHDTVMAGGA